MWFKILLVWCCLQKIYAEIATPCVTTSCVLRNNCYQNISLITDGSGLIDIRIVNNGDTGIPTGPPVTTSAPGVCPVGSDSCCSGPSAVGCGIRYSIPPTPVTTPAPGQLRYGGQPWQAIIFDLNNNFVGAGALIDANNVITVAHKVQGRANGTLKVRLGEWNVAVLVETYTPQEIMVSQIRIHPLYNLSVPLNMNNLQNDVAILRLATPVTMNNPAINTICLPPPTQIFDGIRCLVAGWGKDAFNGSFQAISREVEVPVIPYADCQTKLRATPRLGSLFNLDPVSFICAGGEPGKDACTGDGGAALACIAGGRYQLAGLVAWGIGCADNNVPGVYVKVSSFVSWTNAQLTS